MLVSNQSLHSFCHHGHSRTSLSHPLCCRAVCSTVASSPGNANDPVKVYMLWPMLSMNNSGIATKAACNILGISGSNVLVVYDDMDLKVGTWKRSLARENGTCGGQRCMPTLVEAVLLDMLLL